MNRRHLVYNALRTPDGTVIASRYRHDYVTHMDANGKEYMVDGGLSYIRASAHGDEEFTPLYTDSPHAEIRNVVTWGTYGKDGKGPRKDKLIRDLSNNHIEAILETQPQIRRGTMHKILVDEQQYRADFTCSQDREKDDHE